MTRQYFYRVGDCPADGPNSPDCICWHDEGTGPSLRVGAFITTWRDKPERPATKSVDCEFYAVDHGRAQYDQTCTVRGKRLKDGTLLVEDVSFSNAQPSPDGRPPTDYLKVDRPVAKSQALGAPYGGTTAEPQGYKLPDGSGFFTGKLPLPTDHWIYAERDLLADIPEPILTHQLREQVVAAVQYAIRAATCNGRDMDFDPDALVQNAVLALCGAYGCAIHAKAKDQK